MKRHAIAVCLLAAALGVYAQTHEKDSLRVINLQEVEVISTRATANTPVAFTNVSKEQLKKQNFGQDLPYLLSMTPSAITTSDAGAGVGYTTLRVRGTDGTRINVTANGVPINDAESHTVFWVNLPDFASSVKDMQIQRGAGTSTNGAGAFGASINMQTGDFSMKPYAEFNGSYGSFNTHKETVKVGTGLIDEHWSFDARLSNISTDGYIDRASVGLNSYYLQGGYYDDNTSIKLITFAGKERTYHAWNYASKEEMELYGRRYNSCGFMYTTDDGTPHFYDDQTDNYTQKNYQLLLNHNFTSQWNLNIGLHYTKGDGYYQEYKGGRSLVEYGMAPFEHNGSLVEKSDLIRKKAMDNWFGGGIFSVSYKGDRLNASLGGGLNRYDGDHFGKVLWVQNYIGTLDPDHDYYQNNATKNDGNIYLKANYELFGSLSAYLDLQYRHIDYKINGSNDKYDWTATTPGMQKLAIDENFDFFNPKAGLSWQIDRNNRLYGSFSVAHKEPTRNNYTDGYFTNHPKAERLFDYELGYTYANSWLSAGANLYYMDYKDQLVLTGELNEIGEPMANNVPDSYRMGIELMAGIKLPCGFQWDINATLSKNRVQDFTETLFEDGTVGTEAWVIKHDDTPIAFSPDFILNNRFGYTFRGFEAALQSQYISKQYMSNARQEECTLDAYFVSNLNLSYTFKLPKLKSVTVGCTIYNLFNEEYENNGYAGSYYEIENGEKVRYNDAGYAAQAGTNVLGHIAISF
ncbi:TonB-dependent receptor [Bacteroides sp. GD17]|uniref:TonB-dependent receptor n=1 Tax=Bacteroides sp. GD17 TaxID=3139826 RepID=UPI0026008DF2|nr:TonB-dependent receptor [uncultured Bacteroides sp.]